MGSLVQKPHGLPSWSEPQTLEKAKDRIWNLGKTMHEHAYLIGCHLLWVKEKIEHGNFLPWVADNLWFSRSTAHNMMLYAKQCNEERNLLPYEPKKFPTVGNLETPKLPEGKHFVIYADPPWSFRNTGFAQSAKSQYPTMEVDEISAVAVSELICDQAVLFLWVPNAILEDGLTVCDAWGFDYKTNRVWIKDRAPGMGWYVESKHEILLIGIKGDGVFPREKVSSWFAADVARHSRKPDLVYDDIERMFPGPYLELFARQERPGWTAWGNEI